MAKILSFGKLSSESSPAAIKFLLNINPKKKSNNENTNPPLPLYDPPDFL